MRRYRRRRASNSLQRLDGADIFGLDTVVVNVANDQHVIQGLSKINERQGRLESRLNLPEVHVVWDILHCALSSDATDPLRAESGTKLC